MTTVAKDFAPLAPGADSRRGFFTVQAAGQLFGLPVDAVQTIFKRMFEDGLIYRAERTINWRPGCLTALSDIEDEQYDDDGNGRA